MFWNYLKIAFRNLLRNRLFSLINILGLAIGITACLLIIMFINYEFSYENMISNPEMIYRVLTIDAALGTNKQRVGITMPPLGGVLEEKFPEIESATRITGGGRRLLQKGTDPGIFVEKIRTADTNFFEIFDFDLLRGDPATALEEPFSIILSNNVAKSLFGEDDPLGQDLVFSRDLDLKVTGVFADLPSNSHFDFGALLSLSTSEAQARARQPEGATQPIWLEEWHMIAMPTYMKLSRKTDIEELERKINSLIREYGVEENFSITLQALKDVHLHSTDVIFDKIARKGDIKNIYIFSIIAVLILMIGAVNYMNLSTACSMKRAREVGIRKVVGSMKNQLRCQFLGESILITIISVIISIPLLELTMPFISNITGTELELSAAQIKIMVGGLFTICVLIGIGAGLYPAFVLSHYDPITVLSISFKSQKKGKFLRRLLVVFQFTLSIGLIALTIIIQQQLNYLSNRDIGYNRDQVVLFEMYDGEMFRQQAGFSESLSGFSGFSRIGGSNNVPGRTFNRNSVLPEGASEEDIWIWNSFGIDPDFLAVMDMEIVRGRNFYHSDEGNNDASVLINETAVRQLGWQDPIGKKIYRDPADTLGFEVVGVVKDFNFITMHQNIEPVIIRPLEERTGDIIIARIEKGKIKEALDFAEKKWQEFFADYPFTYTFMDDEFNTIYARDLKTGVVVKIFSFLTIFVACLGLLGLSMHSINQRRKEISIRKVLGSSAFEIVRLLVYNFIQWVALAIIFAIPLGWYVSGLWLKNFSYKIEIQIAVFIVAGSTALVIAVASVIFQTMKAANANPADAIKYE